MAYPIVAETAVVLGAAAVVARDLGYAYLDETKNISISMTAQQGFLTQQNAK